MSYTGGKGTTISYEYKALAEETKTFPGMREIEDEMFEEVENGDFEQLWDAFEGERQKIQRYLIQMRKVYQLVLEQKQEQVTTLKWELAIL